MGRSIVGEDKLLKVLKDLSVESHYSFGLILGQSTSLKDFIFHFAASTSLTEEVDENKDAVEGGDICSVKDLGDYDDNRIGTQTRNVIKMLPGGMTILGVFVTCPQNSSSQSAIFNKLRTLAIHSFNSIKNNSYLHLENNSNKLLLQYSMHNKTYVTKYVDAASLNASLQPADIKFVNEPLSWYSVDASINLGNFGSMFVPRSKEKYTMKKLLKDMLSLIKAKIDNCECSIDRKFIDLSDDLKTFKEKEERKIKELEKSTGKKMIFDPNSVEVQLYERRPPDETSFKVEDVEECIEVNYKGDICSRVYVVGSTTLQDTVKAVKEDLLRCCSSKFEMHWETNDDVIIKNGERKNEELHVLPCRILFSIPESGVQLTEYLFLDESAEDIIPSIQENLGIKINESNIVDDLEAKCDISVISTPPETPRGNTSVVTAKRSNNTIYISIIFLSIVVLIIAIFIQFK